MSGKSSLLAAVEVRDPMNAGAANACVGQKFVTENERVRVWGASTAQTVRCQSRSPGA